MKRRTLLDLFLLLSIVIAILCVSATVFAAGAGVGIINVPPNYQSVELSTNQSAITINLPRGILSLNVT